MRSKPKSTLWTGQPSKYAHAKLDGHFVRVTNERVLTSHPTDITRQLPDGLLRETKRLPYGFTALGELHVPGRPASVVKSALAGNSGRDELALTYFAMESGPVDAGLESVRALFEGLGLPFAPFIPAGALPWDERELLDWARRDHIEGWVMKDGNLLNWRKLKRVSTIDCVVTGYEDGDGKYLGLLGSLRVGVYPVKGGPLVEIANVSGMTDEERVRMTDEIDSLEGRVVEVAYQYIGSGGRLRHPRFVRWRDDKAPWECRTDQDPDLQEYHG